MPADKTLSAWHAAAKNSRPEPCEDGSGARRRRMLEWMRAQRAPVRGEALARRFGVSRQCVVQDVAILRAGGTEILATPRGYRFPAAGRADGAGRAHRVVLACRHSPERTREELEIFVDHGVKVLDVIVEHPIYGELRGALEIESRADVDDFLKRVRAMHAALLSSLTGGVHLHTVEASRREMISRAAAKLRARGILLK